MKLSKKEIVARTLRVKTLGIEVAPDSSGAYDLNVVWKQAKLSASQRPSQWRDASRKTMELTANLHAGKNASGDTTMATEQGLYAYCMWVSPEFYMAVVNAFAALVRGDVAAAQQIANETVCVHEVMREKVKGYEIHEYLECFRNIDDAVSSFITAMHNNKKAGYQDRVSTLKALEYQLNKARDDLSNRDLSGIARFEAAEKMVKAEGQRLARITSEHSH